MTRGGREKLAHCHDRAWGCNRVFWRVPRLCRLNLHQNPGETLHIRRLENGLERPGGRSHPTPRGLASLVGTDAFAG
jgi:hypothetical protein